MGSNWRAKEEAVMMWFSELFHEIEGELCYWTLASI